MMTEQKYFATSLILEGHPVHKAKYQLKVQYYSALEYFVLSRYSNKYIDERLKQYRMSFFGSQLEIQNHKNLEKEIKSIINTYINPWKSKYRYYLLCDIALILISENLIQDALKDMISFTKQKKVIHRLNLLSNSLMNDKNIDPLFSDAKDLIMQYKRNKEYLKQPTRKFIVTANISAGKSTLINAMFGKKLAKTSQQVCTPNIGYFFNKAFDDGRVHIEHSDFTMNADFRELNSISWDREMKVAAHLDTFLDIKDSHICIIDTPGMNSVINETHAILSAEAMKKDSFEKIVYILNANKLGSDEELKHLKWVAENLPKDRVIFVLNKLDTYKLIEDDIETTISKLHNELQELGYENPVICPVSARFSLLIKMKQNGIEMTEDELDEYNFYVKKFNKPNYNLSKYYDYEQENYNDNEMISLGKKCGMYGLEKRLFGGK